MSWSPGIFGRFGRSHWFGAHLLQLAIKEILVTAELTNQSIVIVNCSRYYSNNK